MLPRVRFKFSKSQSESEYVLAFTSSALTPRRCRGARRPDRASSLPLLKDGGRREGRVPPHPWSACNKKARGRTTGTGGSSGLPCAMVLRLIRDLPGDRAFLPPSPCRNKFLRDLAPASGRQDHTISPSAAMPLVIDIACVHRIPPRVRDDRDPPLLSRRDDVSNDSFRKKRKQNIFARRDWTTQISLIGQAKLDFWRKRFSATLWVQRGRRRAETQPICPSGNGF